MEEKETEKKNGTIVFLPFAEGSKSESIKPFLYLRRDEKFPLYFESDNPFENNGFEKYDGQNVEVSGRFDNGTFVVVKVDYMSKTNMEEKHND